MPQQGPLSVKSAINKLINMSKVIQHCISLREAKEKHVKDTSMLLATGPPPAKSKGAKQQVIYLDFLHRVQRVLGFSEVVLCAARLGLVSWRNMSVYV